MVECHAEPLVGLRIAPPDLINGSIGIVLITLRFLRELGHMGVVPNYC